MRISLADDTQTTELSIKRKFLELVAANSAGGIRKDYDSML